MPACAKLTKNGPIDYQYDYRSGSNRKARPAAFSVLAGGRNPSRFRGFGVVKWWEYGANNPVRFSDPTGQYAQVSVDGNNVTIVLPIDYTGSGATVDTILKFNEQIERVWTGKFGKYNVKTLVVTPDSDCPDEKKNTVKIYPKHLEGSSTSSFYQRSGSWYSSRANYNTSPAAHEAGHLMGLTGPEYGDQYDRKTYRPKPGYETNIMGGPPRTGVEEWQIEHIIRMNQ